MVICLRDTLPATRVKEKTVARITNRLYLVAVCGCVGWGYAGGGKDWLDAVRRSEDV